MFNPVDPRVRLAIVQWPPDAPRGPITTFCSGAWDLGGDVLRAPEAGGGGWAGGGVGAAVKTAAQQPVADRR